MTTDALVLRNVSFAFGGLRAVSGLDLAIEEGAITALLGPNGAGKTTVFNLVGGFLRPDTGEIRYRSRRIDRLPAFEIARLGIGRFFQNVRLFQRMTGLENVLLALQGAADESALRTVLAHPGRSGREANLRDMARSHLAALQLEELADRPAADLSYGQQKLLALARLLALDAHLLLLDEPLAGLSPSALVRMLDIMRGARASGRTILLIEHNIDVVRTVSDRIAFMSQGRLLLQGGVGEVLGDRRLADEYLGLPT